MENIVAARIQARMDELGKNPSSVALEAGLGRSSVRDILLGRVLHPRIDTLRKIAVPLECTIDYLTGESEKPDAVGIRRHLWHMDAMIDHPDLIEAGVFRRVSPGTPWEPIEDAETFLQVSLADPRLPVWRPSIYIMGDNSLENINILKGDGITAINHPYDAQIPLTNGALVVVRQSIRELEIEEISARQVEVTKEGISLVCRSKASYPPILIPTYSIDNESKIIPNYYPLGKTSAEIMAVVTRVTRELPISDPMYDLTHDDD